MAEIRVAESACVLDAEALGALAQARARRAQRHEQHVALGRRHLVQRSEGTRAQETGKGYDASASIYRSIVECCCCVGFDYQIRIRRVGEKFAIINIELQ